MMQKTKNEVGKMNRGKRMTKRKIRQNLILTGVNLFFIILSFAILVPILYALSVSLNAENSLLSTDFSFIPKHLTLQNYKAVFVEEPILIWFKNSMILAVITLFLSLGTGIPAAYSYNFV